MKRIDTYIETVYADLDQKSIEVIELKEEMKNHLIDAVSDLKEQGLPEKEAIEVAIERFGEENQLSNKLIVVCKFRRLFAKKLLSAALAIFLVGFVVWVGLIWRDKVYQNTQYSLTKGMLELIGEKNQLSEGTKQEINSILSKHSNVGYFAISKKLDPSDASKELVYREFNQNRAIIISENRGWIVQFQFDNYAYRTLYHIPYTLFVISLLIFTSWTIINIYHHHRLNKVKLILE